MHDLKYWCRALCIIVIISGVLLSFIPDSKLNNSYKALVSLMIIYMLISPFSNSNSIDSLASFSDYTSGITEDELLLNDSSLVLDCAENLLNTTLNDALRKAALDAECKTHIKENKNEAYISKIDVYGNLAENEETEVVYIIKGIAGGVEIDFIG